MTAAPSIPVVPLCIASLLAVHGKRKKSLSPSGAIAAFVVGFLTMAVPLKTFGVSLIVFYLIGSRATKVGQPLKSTLEEGHEEAGYRDAMQVSSLALEVEATRLIRLSRFSQTVSLR